MHTHAGGDARGVRLEETERRFHRVLYALVRTQALGFELEIARDRLVLQLVDGIVAVECSTDAENVSRQQRPVGHERVVALLGDGHHAHLHGVVGVDVAQVHVDELDAGHDLQLLLHAPAPLYGVFQQHGGIFLGHALVREEQLSKAAERLAHANLVAFVEVAVQAEVLVDQVSEVTLAHFAAELAQAVGDQPVVVRQQVAAHLRHLPAGKVAMDAVEESRVVVEFRRERIEQVGGLQHVSHRVVDVALEDHRRVRVQLVLATRERARRHIVLQDLDRVHVLEVHARHLVEGDAVPVADEAHALHGARTVARVHAPEQVRRGCLATRQQDRVGRYLLVHMALTRAARS